MDDLLVFIGILAVIAVAARIAFEIQLAVVHKLACWSSQPGEHCHRCNGRGRKHGFCFCCGGTGRHHFHRTTTRKGKS
ncbi:MAG: hypothetical protein ACRD0P_01685 [Stackebrandtia sp.]